jgi:hypothetical protein
LADESVHHGESQASALTGGLGRKKRFEHAPVQVGWDTGTRIAYRQQRVAPRGDPVALHGVDRMRDLHVTAAHEDRAAAGGRVPRVDDKVEEDLIELQAVGRHVGRGDLDLQRGAHAHEATQHRRQRVHRFAQIEHGGPQRLLATECQEMVRELGGAIGGGGNFLQ